MRSVLLVGYCCSLVFVACCAVFARDGCLARAVCRSLISGVVVRCSVVLVGCCCVGVYCLLVGVRYCVSSVARYCVFLF